MPGERLRIVRPGAALALGLLTLVMLISAVVTGSIAHQLHSSNYGTGALFISFGLSGMTGGHSLATRVSTS